MTNHKDLRNLDYRYIIEYNIYNRKDEIMELFYKVMSNAISEGDITLIDALIIKYWILKHFEEKEKK